MDLEKINLAKYGIYITLSKNSLEKKQAKINLAKYGICITLSKDSLEKKPALDSVTFNTQKMYKNRNLGVFVYKILLSDWSVLNFSIFSLKA